MARFTLCLVVLTVAALNVQAAPPSPYTPYTAKTYAGSTFHVLTNTAALPNPAWQVQPGLPLHQFTYNIKEIGTAYKAVPPYALGFNPYLHHVTVYPGSSPFVPSYPMTAYPYMPYTGVSLERIHYLSGLR